ncbi:MAG: hypothetical protein K5681_04740 [Treponema sp.]|nr:hypothetical protein [Treponema sp.]
MKFISGFAVFGFVLSFVSSLFSPHSSFIHKLLVALLFAVIFAILGFVIKIVFDKFLNDSDGDFSSDFAPSAQSVVTAGPQKGQLVDIVIQDEEIAPGESSNRFVVGDNHQMLNDTDVKDSGSSSFVENKPEAAKSMVVPNVTQMSSPEEPVIIEHDQGVQQTQPKPVPESAPVSENKGGSSFVPMNAAALTHVDLSNESEAIDTLPDMNNFSFGSSESSSEEDDNGYEDDSGFEPSYTSSEKAEVPEVKDAGLIAKAISSVLADEKSI